MSAEISPENASLEWLTHPTHPACKPDAALLSWLTYQHVLTVRMKTESSEPFRLQLLDSISGQGQMLDTESIRRVILWSGDTPCIYAESYLPKAAMMALPDLRDLGGAPLGEFLNSHSEISRSPLEYALLNSPRLPAPIEDQGNQPLWARKAHYSVGDSGLTVAEMFLPGITRLQPNTQV